MNEVGLWSLVPPVVAIVLALVTREIVLSLVAAILSGTAVYVAFAGGSPLEVFKLFTDTIGSKMSANMSMVLFLCFLGALVSVVTRAGGAKAYGDWAYRKLNSECAANQQPTRPAVDRKDAINPLYIPASTLNASTAHSSSMRSVLP